MKPVTDVIEQLCLLLLIYMFKQQYMQ